jgi:phosphate transport system substrate-binding protein
MALAKGGIQLGIQRILPTSAENDAYYEKAGHNPVIVGVAKSPYDKKTGDILALKICVNKANPLDSLTAAQVDAIFSKTTNGAEAPILSWGQAGVAGEMGTKGIHIYGRAVGNARSIVFAQKALYHGEFKPSLAGLPSDDLIGKILAEDPNGIGIIESGKMYPDVKVLAIAGGEGAPGVLPTADTIASGAYTLYRGAYLFVNRGDTDDPLDPLVSEFLKVAYSKEGQAAAVKEGYFPETAKDASHALAMVK